jgi:hypothetical protein
VTPAELLRAAKELLRQGHCKGAFARAEDGSEVRPRSPRACSWCIVGALLRACDGRDCREYHYALDAIQVTLDRRAKCKRAIGGHNDVLPLETVLAALDDAIPEAA